MKKIILVQKYFIIIFFIFFISLLPSVLLATTSNYTPLVDIPGVSGEDVRSIDAIVRALFTILISLAALLAVLKLIIAGAKYMMSDVVTTKQSAISDIKGAIFGLILVLSTVLILWTINRDITENTTIQLGDGSGGTNDAANGGTSQSAHDCPEGQSPGPQPGVCTTDAHPISP